MPRQEAYHTKEITNIVKESKTSFYWAMRLLPKEKREAMYAIYAFCRQVDDIADEPAPLDQKKQALFQWRNDIEKIYNNQTPSQNVALALIPHIKAFNLPKEEFISLIDGMEMDIPDGMVAPQLNELELYCRRVAGTVGILSVCIFGDASKEATNFALILGEAVQITNILRDMDEDANLGRLYMPKEFIEKANISIDNNKSLIHFINNKNIGIARQELAKIAQIRYTEADIMLQKLNKKNLKPAIIIKEIYYDIFKRLEKRGWDHILPRVKKSKIRILLIILKSFFI